jgi:uncharacterized membrane protein YfcA
VTIETALVVAAVFLLATTVAAVAGFGNSLVAMPMLIGLVGVRTATPLMAIAGLFTWLMLSARATRAVDRAVWPLIASSIALTPIGVIAVTFGPEVWLRTALGAVTIAYVVYRWTGRHAPRLGGRRWAMFFGSLGGVFSGALNSSGPIVVMYGDTQRWAPTVFRANLAVYFTANLVAVTIGHLVAGNVTAPVLVGAAVAVPAVLVGVAIGSVVARRISGELFARLTLALLAVLGLRMVTSWLA